MKRNHKHRSPLARLSRRQRWTTTTQRQGDDDGEREQQQRGNESSWPTTSTRLPTTPRRVAISPRRHITTIALVGRLLRLPIFLWNIEYQFVKTDFSIPQAYLHIYFPWGMEARLERRALSTNWHINWGSLQSQPELRVRWVGGQFVHKNPSKSFNRLTPSPRILQCWTSTNVSDWLCTICCAVEKARIQRTRNNLRPDRRIFHSRS